MVQIALIDAGSGNLRSVQRALLAAADPARPEPQVRITSDPDFVRQADAIVLPGQGAFGACMAGLRACPGLEAALTEAAMQHAIPFLGICVGMQVLAARGEENGLHEGLGWIGGLCRPLSPIGGPIPHMGWNTIEPLASHPVLDGLGASAHVYFAHSFIVDGAPAPAIAARTTHNEQFASALAQDNLIGLQFHPEKSQAAGLALLARFLDWKP